MIDYCLKMYDEEKSPELLDDYRKTDSWKCVKPSNFVYPRARELVKQYRREYAESCAELD